MTRPTRSRTKVATRAAVVALAAALGLSACSGSSTPLADTRVVAKQRALEDAQKAATAANAAFCSAAADYVTAVDRYGDVLNATAPTVGDVKTAGRDLEQPREDAMAAAEAAVSAQEAVVQAEQDLADAKAAQSAAGSSSSTATGSTAPSPSPTASSSASTTPAVAPATVSRVQQAEQEFTSAQQGISEQTPLRQASQQFNAAAVALEMSWLALFADAGCLTDESQQAAQKAVHDYTATLQQSLTDAGYYTGKVDGVYGPSTVQAVQALQKAHGLPVTGTLDKATAAALQSDLQAKGGAAAQAAQASTAAVQQTLKLAGFWDGPVDGQWTPALTEALKKFQTHLGVPATGTVDAATVAALEQAIAKLGAPAPTATATATVTVTATPSSSAT